MGLSPLFICNKSEIENLPPVFIHVLRNQNEPDQQDPNQDPPDVNSSSLNWAPSILNKILMKYVSSSHELKILMASIHDFKPKIDVLLFHNLNSIIDPNNNLSIHDDVAFNRVAQIIRFIDDATTYISRHHHHVPNTKTTSSDISTHTPGNSTVEIKTCPLLRLIIGNQSNNSTFKHLLKQISQRRNLIIKSSVRSVIPAGHTHTHTTPGSDDHKLDICLHITKNKPIDEDVTMTIFNNIRKSHDSKSLILNYVNT
jgi:hypothetical protein